MCCMSGISGVVGAVSGIIVSNRYNYALKNYGFSQGDIGKMMITFADTRSYLRAAIGYQDENLVNSCAENYEKKKESCQQYTKEVKNTVSSADEEKIYNSITEKLNDYFDTFNIISIRKNRWDICCNKVFYLMIFLFNFYCKFILTLFYHFT